MSQPTIDLSRGLEVWYDFDPDYYDSQRGEIEDKSGYGRHAEASGGPTVGVEGPAAFEATSLDGTDDMFDVGEVLASQEQTWFSLVYVDNFDGISNIIGNATSGYTNGASLLTNNRQEFEFNFADGDGNKINHRWSADTERWYTVIGRWDGSETSIIVNGEISETLETTGHTQAVEEVEIGGGAGSFGYLDGKLAAVGKWDRALNSAETEYLSKLTGPRRVHL